MRSIGIDLGGTKIAGVVLDTDGTVLTQRRVATPQGDYEATMTAVIALIRQLERDAGAALPVGIGTPGAVSPLSGAMKNCNSTCLNGRFLREDLQALLGRPVSIANDADCLALSEAVDGAGQGAATLFAVILGTGVGGGIVVHGHLLRGPNAIAGEWGHNVLPGLGEWYEDERRACYCGRFNCVETYVSGPGLSRTYARLGGGEATAQTIVDCAGHDGRAAEALHRYVQQLAAASAQIINILDPAVIVLGGGLSNASALYEQVPGLWSRHVFSDSVRTRLLPARFGDASGVRGAARLCWD